MRAPPAVELSDGLVLLRRWQVDDIDDLHQAALESVAEVSRWLDWCHPGYRREEAEDWVERVAKMWRDGTGYQFAVRGVANGDFLGACGLNQIAREHRLCNLGYWTRTGRCGQGVATAAARLATRFAVEELDLNRVEIVVAERNIASLRVAEKLGARREAVLAERLMVGGRALDAVMYCVLARDLVPG